MADRNFIQFLNFHIHDRLLRSGGLTSVRGTLHIGNVPFDLDITAALKDLRSRLLIKQIKFVAATAATAM